MNQLARKVFLVGGDILWFYIALAIGLKLRYFDSYSFTTFQEHFIPFSIVFLGWLIIFFINDVYDLKVSQTLFNYFAVLIKALLTGGILAIIVFYLIPESDVTPKRFLVLVAGLFFVLSIAWRYIYGLIFSRPNFREIVTFVTKDSTKNPLIADLKEEDSPIYEYKSVIQREDLARIAEKQNPDIIVVEEDPHINRELSKQLHQFIKDGKRVVDLNHFYEETLHKIPVPEITEVWFLENIQEANKKAFEVVTRLLDIIFAGLTLILYFPIFVLSALLIKLESKGPVIFTQTRSGKDGEKFKMFKLRTMVENAEAKQQPLWAEKDDPRITKVGKVLRKTRMDEIPQLMNVLYGDMSIVGPRPERPEFVEKLKEDIPFYEERHLVKPGLTGWAQIHYPYGASVEDALNKLQFDLYYIKHRSIYLDIAIMLKTILIVIGAKGR